MQFTNTKDQFKMVDDIYTVKDQTMSWQSCEKTTQKKNLSRQHTLFAFNLDVFTLSQFKRKI